MELVEILGSAHSKKVTEQALAFIGDDPSRFKALMDLIFGKDENMQRRAAWVLGYKANENPDLVTPYLPKIVTLLSKKGLHNAMQRNIYRFLQNLDIPENLEGDVAEAAIAHLKDPKVAVAIKAFAMTTLGNLVRKYPELANEIRPVIEDQWEQNTAAFKVRARRLFKQMDR